MLAERLQARCRSARVIGIAECAGYALSFHKRSVDGSGKAALHPANTTQDEVSVCGVVYEIDARERATLDRFEGNGYDAIEKLLVIDPATGLMTRAVSYVAQSDALVNGLRPYDWYMALIIAGARQNGLPKPYISQLQAVTSTPDPVSNRPTRQEAVQVLKSAGFPFST